MKNLPTVAAVVVTRNRIDMLRETLQSIRQDTYPIREIVVSDDSADDRTRTMLAAEFPGVFYTQGPRRGISANRNHGIRQVEADYILLSDDDMVVDGHFVERAMELVVQERAEMVFTGTSDFGETIFPNTFDFLGFASKPYQLNQRYNTANQQCFIVSKQLALTLQYDEIIASYGYEEMDYAYRVAAANHRLDCVRSCVNIHLAPNRDQPFRAEQDACRLYVTYKRYAYVDHRPLKALVFLVVAVPHHLCACVRRAGVRNGTSQWWANLGLASDMLRKFVTSLEGNAMPAPSPRGGRG
jgi:glycosyltransferase involved in cell wall biosynthesis